MSNEPKKPPSKNSLDALAEFTKKILRVPKSELRDNSTSETQKSEKGMANLPQEDA